MEIKPPQRVKIIMNETDRIIELMQAEFNISSDSPIVFTTRAKVADVVRFVLRNSEIKRLQEREARLIEALKYSSQEIFRIKSDLHIEPPAIVYELGRLQQYVQKAIEAEKDK